MNFLFAYGSLKDPDFQKRLFSSVCGQQKATLHDHSLALIDRFPTVVPFPNRSVEGIILELTDQQLQQADYWEGENYSREKRQVIYQGSLLNCWVYWSHLSHTQLIDRYELSEELKQRLLTEDLEEFI